MKPIRTILVLCVFIGIGAVNVCAQNTSSASQTITFGVHRSASVVVASAQTSSVMVTETGLERTSPLKITVGSDERSLAFSEPVNVASARSFAENKSTLSAVKSFSIKSFQAEKPVVTLTE